MKFRQKNNLIQHNKFINYIESKHCAEDPTNFRIRETNVMCENEGLKKAAVTCDGSFIFLFLVFNAISGEFGSSLVLPQYVCKLDDLQLS